MFVVNLLLFIVTRLSSEDGMLMRKEEAKVKNETMGTQQRKEMNDVRTSSVLHDFLLHRNLQLILLLSTRAK